MHTLYFWCSKNGSKFQAGFQPLVIFEGSGVQFLRDNLENHKRCTLTNDSWWFEETRILAKQNEPVQKVGYQILYTNKNAPE